MLPMGTIVTCCMFAGLFVAAELPVSRRLPSWIRTAVGIIVLVAGAWNTFWYGLRHLAEFWGFSALVSGVLMIVTALFILVPGKLPGAMLKLKPILLVVLLGYALMYAITIARI